MRAPRGRNGPHGKRLGASAVRHIEVRVTDTENRDADFQHTSFFDIATNGLLTHTDASSEKEAMP